VDFENKLIRLDNDVKTPGSAEPVPLSEYACEVLQAWNKEQANKSPFVFPSPHLPDQPISVGVREFRERIASFLESDTPVAVTRRGETLGVYVPTRRKRPKTAHMSELKEAADRLASALADVDEEELLADFKELRRRGKDASR
jgi:hypothetical protein